MLVLFANETRLVAISIELGSSILYRCGDFVIYGLIYIRVISEFKTLGGVFKNAAGSGGAGNLHLASSTNPTFSHR